MDDDDVELADARTTDRMQVIGRVSGHRAWSVEQKLVMLRDAFGPGGLVCASMDRHEITSGLLYTWRCRAMSGELAGTPQPMLPSFAEVRVADHPPVVRTTTPPSGAMETSRRIGIELRSGVKLSVDASVDVEKLGRVL